MKRFLLPFLILFSVLVVVAAFSYLFKSKPLVKSQPGTLPATDERLNNFAKEARLYASHKGFNTKVAMLVDMRLESGKSRFFVYDIARDSILDRGLVTHGRCNENWLVGRRYGNGVGCGCTSLGKYKIGNSYEGRFGLAYKLKGLDTTNNNAFKRYVVLHSHSCVPDREVYPAPICQSDGCPTVSKQFLRRLSIIIDNSPKPILLWIYD